MNIKIQGGGSGTYANTGSCTGVTTYLQHEDLERMKNGREVQPFFNNSRDYISAQEVTFKIDNNKAKLSRNDAKFYVITVSPSSRELEKMGKTEKEQAEAMRKYVRDDVMQHYAEGFGKGLNKEDIEYYGKIHFERKGADRYDMHAHIIVSRKDRSNTRNKAGKRANNRETVFPKFRKSTRRHSGRSNRRKNSTSPGKKAGVLEWVCDSTYTYRLC